MSGNGGERRCFTCLMSFQILFLETDNQLPCSQAIFYFVWNDQTVPSHREAIEYKNKCNEATIKRTPEVCYLREVSKKVQQPQMEGRNFPVKLLPGQEQKINDWWFLFFFFLISCQLLDCAIWRSWSLPEGSIAQSGWKWCPELPAVLPAWALKSKPFTSESCRGT